ncbi:MAG: MnmC family methyltransferase [Methanobacteriaceae archaeon]|nr:MnmC family methyltransferase [Methanobacteriaceae archaeon]MDO9626337.1 MnmC family methyltransferase [Methanobacteriaceae archaeon]
MNYQHSESLTPQKEAISLINYYFQKEIHGDLKARNHLKNEFLKYLIKTDDGSYTLNSGEINGNSETMHTNKGAITESLEKFVKPSNLNNKSNIKVLDTCSGFGYNSATLIDYLGADSNTDIDLSLDLIEISIETLAGGLLVPVPLATHNIVKKAIEEKLIKENYAKFNFEKGTIPKNIQFNIYSKDAREVVQNLDSDYYDAIFLDPFSPSKAPELYTVEFFKELKRIIKNDGVLATYTSAAPVRSALVEAGFYIGEGPIFGRKSGGTIASNSLSNIKKDISEADERMISLSDVGIPFIDPFLDLSGTEISKNRSIARKKARGTYKFSSAAKAPIFLGKEIEMNRWGRKVVRNINQLHIDDLKSKKALYLVCCQNELCYCGCNINRISNSRDRIKKMSQRLSNLRNVME